MKCFCDSVEIGTSVAILRPDPECPERQHRHMAWGVRGISLEDVHLLDSAYVLARLEELVVGAPRSITVGEAYQIRQAVDTALLKVSEVLGAQGSAASGSGPRQDALHILHRG